MPGIRTSDGFENFDDPSIYAKYEKAVLHADTLNFVVDFESETASSALNVDLQFMKKVLSTQVGDLIPNKSLTGRSLKYLPLRADTDLKLSAGRESEDSMDVSRDYEH